jgi:hypothetical protein
MIQRVRMGERFFRQTRQKIAEILVVFQDFLTQYGKKSAAKTCARNHLAVIKEESK